MKKRVLLLSAIIGLLANFTAFSQERRTISTGYSNYSYNNYNNGYRSSTGRSLRSYDNDYEYDGDYGGNTLLVNAYSYKKYFYNDEPKDSNHAKFSMVTETSYRAYDSLMKSKKMMSKTTKIFNKKGFELFEMEVDSNGKVKDSTRTVYDAKFNICRESQYARDDSGVIYRSRFMAVKYDAKNNMIMDSIYSIYGNPDNPPRVTRTLYTYNDSGSELSHSRITISDEDTSKEYSHSVYDKDNNLVFSETIGDDDTSREYHTYNSKGKEIFAANVRVGGDSSFSKKRFNSKGDQVSYERYEGGKLAEVVTDSTDARGNIIETEEKLSTADALSCPNNTVTVTVTDTSGRVLSYVETKEKDGNQLVTTSIHKYVLDKNRIVLDTISMVEEGFMYSELKQEVKKNQFDKNGNMVEQSAEGGGQYSSDYRYTWLYNDQGNMLEEAHYNSCTTDKLSLRSTYTYYKDGKSIKSVSTLSAYGSRSTISYNENSRIEQEFTTAGDYLSDYLHMGSSKKNDDKSVKQYFQTMYEYKK